jgi:hypothetical protein
MTGCQIEVFLTYPAPPVCLPHGRTGIRVRAAKCRGEELDLPSLELGMFVPAKNLASLGSPVTRI